MKKHILIIAAIAVAAMAGCKKDEILPTVDEQGLTEDIHKIIPDEYIKVLKDLGLNIYGGNKPPKIEGKYLASPLVFVNKNFLEKLAEMDNMRVTFYGQNNTALTVKMDYTMDILSSPAGKMEVSGMGGFIVGEGNRFTAFIDAKRKEGGYTAKTVEVFSGEITTGGIKDFHWAVIMIDNNGNPLGIWIPNGTGYVHKDGDGIAVRE